MMRLLYIILCGSIAFLPTWSVGASASDDFEPPAVSDQSCAPEVCCEESSSPPQDPSHHEHNSESCPGKSCHDKGACSHGCGPSKTAPSSQGHLKSHETVDTAFASDSEADFVDRSAALSPQQIEEVDSPPPRS